MYIQYKMYDIQGGRTVAADLVVCHTASYHTLESYRYKAQVLYLYSCVNCERDALKYMGMFISIHEGDEISCSE